MHNIHANMYNLVFDNFNFEFLYEPFEIYSECGWYILIKSGTILYKKYVQNFEFRIF